MKLYEINEQIMDLFDKETGELLDYEAFEQLQMAREEKLENAILYIKDMEGDAAKMKAEIDALTARKRALENRAKGLKEYITRELAGEKFSTPRCAVSYRASKALEVENPVEAAKWLEDNGYKDFVTYASPQISKTDVKRLVAEGEEIPGVELVEHVSTIIK